MTPRSRWLPRSYRDPPRTYLEYGQPVRVLLSAAGRTQRNVLVERADGSRVVRPFRGLRKPP